MFSRFSNQDNFNKIIFEQYGSRHILWKVVLPGWSGSVFIDPTCSFLCVSFHFGILLLLERAKYLLNALCQLEKMILLKSTHLLAMLHHVRC